MMSPPRSQAAGIPRDAGFRFTHVNVQMLMLAHPLTRRHDFAALNLDSNNQRLSNDDAIDLAAERLRYPSAVCQLFFCQ